MGKRPCHKRSRRPALIKGRGLAISTSSAEVGANALRVRHSEFRSQKADPSPAAVRRIPSAIPSPSSSGADNDHSASRRRHDAQTTTSTFSSTSLSDESVQPPSPHAFDLSKTILPSQYTSQMSKRNHGTIQQIKVTPEKARRLIASDGGGAGDAKPEAPAVEGVSRGERGPRFADLGGMEAVIEQLMMEMVVPLCHPELPRRLGVRPVARLLLHGPPGYEKTTLAHAVANETGVPFYKISAPEVVSGVSDQRQGVYVIGATNRIDVIDDAVLRPGRFGKKHFVPLPGANERVSILKACARSKPISSGVDLDALARREECSNLTGADLASLVNEAAMAALEERFEFLENGTSSMTSCCLIELSHFERALSKVKPSVSEQQRKHYEALSKRYSSN